MSPAPVPVAARRGKRVLQVFAPPDGGVAEHVLRLTEGLAQHGWTVDVAGAIGSPFNARLRALGVEVFELPFVRPPHPRDGVVARRLRALGRTGRYDVVHAHSSKAGAIARSALPRGRPLIYTPHGFAFSGAFTGRKAEVYRRIERTLLPRTDALITVCEFERRQAIEELRTTDDRVRMILSGVPDCEGADVDERVTAFAAGRTTIGMVSVLRTEKDPLTLVRAAGLLRDAGRREFCVAIVGDGALSADVDAEIARLGLGELAVRLAFGGAVGPHLRALDVFTVPSLWEALPLSVLEAMACGLPVVETPVGGVAEAVADGVTGRLVTPGSPESLATALGELLDDADLRGRMGAAGRAAYEQRFTLGRMVGEVAALYDELATGARQGA